MKPTRLDELRSILLGPDHEKLDALRSRVEEPGRRAEDVAEVLPDSMAASFRRNSRLIEALRTPLRQCVSESVREDPDEYADALFPVMGPAIRRAVAEAFKGWIQQANQAIEQSLSVRGLGWRLQAWRAGMPFGQYVLQKTLLYRVEHVYLIQSASGLLIEHVHQADALAKDEDAVSAMFTAIQDFVKDSFQRSDSQLRTAELGELTLWAVHGPHAVIVAVLRGMPPTGLRAELASVLEGIEADYSDQLRDYGGERGSLSQLKPRLQKCLLVSMREPAAAGGRRVSPTLWLLVIAALILLAWLGYQLWLQTRVNRLGEVLKTSPGIVVTALDRDGHHLTVRGLRDPLATPLEDLATRAGWTGEITPDLRPFISLEPKLVLARANASLRPPAGVRLELEADTLRVTGQASAAWVATTAAAKLPPGVSAIDLSGVSTPDILARLRQALAPADETELRLEQSRLIVSGAASAAWANGLPAALAEFADIDTVDTSELIIAERQRMEEIAEQSGATAVGFERADTAEGTPSGELDAIASSFTDYAKLARALALTPRMTLIGNTDASGPDALNIELELRRAERVKAELVARGVAGESILTRSQLQSGLPGPRARQVTVRFDALAQDGSASED